LKTGSNRALTLVELMLVIALMGIIAAVAIPKYEQLLEKANLGATLGNLSSLRSAVSVYYATFMKFPASIDPAIAPQFGTILNGSVPCVMARYPAAHPPYGNGVETGTYDSPTGSGSGWYYNSLKGSVFINSVEHDGESNAYSSY
jgi:prepilin-type N-terminal cleavage/methylation domain-containing protein